MYGAIAALIISLMMIALVIYKGQNTQQHRICCRKSEVEAFLRNIPDDCIIEVWLGRNSYDEFPFGKAYGRNLRNHISE